MLPPAVGTFENPRSSRQLISQPPGAPGADEPVGSTQLRQCGNARRLIPIAIHECEKSGHHRPLPPPQDRRRIPAEHEHIKNLTPHPALTGEGGYGNVLYIETSYGKDVVGEEVYVAARLNELAKPNEIVVSQVALERMPSDYKARAGASESREFKRAGKVKFRRVNLLGL